MVYSVVEKKTGKTLAIKKIKNHRTKDHSWPAADNFREVEILKDLESHPNVIKLVSVITEGSSSDLYLVLESFEISLRRKIERGGRVKGTELLCCSEQLVSAVNFLHANGVLHRDLKTDNILVRGGSCDSSGLHLVIADFGLAKKPPKVLWSECPMTGIVASLWYRAPELMLGARHYSNAIDVWSLGCCLYEMVFGSVAFPGDSEIGTLFRMFKKLGTPKEVELTGGMDVDEGEGSLVFSPCYSVSQRAETSYPQYTRPKVFSANWPKWDKGVALEALYERCPVETNKSEWLSLICGCLTFCVSQRLSAVECSEYIRFHLRGGF